MAPAELVRKLAKNGVYRFSGSVGAGSAPVHIEILAGLRFARPTFAVGFSFVHEPFGRLTEKLSGIRVHFLDVLGTQFEVTKSSVSVLYVSALVFLCYLSAFVLERN